MKLILITILLFAPYLCADEVVLTNGNHLTGKIVKLDDSKLVLDTDYANTIKIKWDSIAGFTSKSPVVIETAETKVATTSLARNGKSIELTNESGSEVTLPSADVKSLRSQSEEQTYEAQMHEGLLSGWAGGGNVGLSLSRGNSQSLSVSTGTNLARATSTDKLTLYNTTVYTKDDLLNAVTANAIQGGLRYDHNLSRRIFAFGSGDFEYDDLQKLDIRSILGGGGGWHAVARKATTFDVLFGLSWTHEKYGTGLVNNIFAPSLGEQLTKKLTANTVFNEQTFFYPYVTGMSVGFFRLAFDSGLNTKISRWFSWQTTLSDRYVSNPLPGTQGNDLLLSTGLGITLAPAKK